MIIMKCVLELAVMRAEADKAYEQEQMRLDNEAKNAFMEATEKAINYCETVIGTHFENQAQNRKDIEYSFKGVILTDRLGNELIAPLYKSGTYANGSPTHKYNSKEAMALAPLKQYLEQFCFTVTQEADIYCWYGLGEQTCVRIDVGV